MPWELAHHMHHPCGLALQSRNPRDQFLSACNSHELSVGIWPFDSYLLHTTNIGAVIANTEPKRGARAHGAGETGGSQNQGRGEQSLPE